ncbi:extracellular solute-binding protein [Paenibacillus terrigena]|uniref:ABC transporter substrate-binding protein n=1 Tax=Paenibacillus terrigena TaxID=369333 RepID=UPI0028D6FF5F|nr:extracellular solute-binding protein [Paenibacillus terrigena]
MKKFKAWSMILILSMIITIVGCSGANKATEQTQDTTKPADTAATTDTTTTTTTTEPAKEDTPTEPAMGADGKIDFKGELIRIGQWWGMENYLSEEEKERQKKAEEKFNVKIEYVTVGFDQIVPRLITSTVAGQPFADVIMIPLVDALPKLAVDGYIRPIDDLVDLNEPIWNKVMKSNGVYDGKQYSFTDKDNNGNGLFYNKTMLQKLGLEDPYALQEKGEWTWDKFLGMAKAATKDDKFGVTDNQLDLAIAFIYANGGSVTTADNQIGFDSPNSMEAIQFVSDLFNVHKVAGGNFAQGTALFYPGYRWSAYDFNPSMSDDWGYVFFPKGPKGTDYVVPSEINLWHLSSSVKSPKAVMAVWKELYEMDAEKGYDGVIKGEEANFRNKESLDTLRKMLGNVTAIKYGSYIGFRGIFDEAIKNIMSGKATATAELARIKPMAQAAIDVTLKK